MDASRDHERVRPRNVLDVLDAQTGESRGTVVDFHAHGMAFATRDEVERGARLDLLLQFDLDDDARGELPTRGEVRWVRPAPFGGNYQIVGLALVPEDRKSVFLHRLLAQRLWHRAH